MITQKTIAEIFETSKVEDIVGDFVNLKRRGANMIGLCPFHNEKTPSFSVSPTKNIYKCFGCGKAGDSVKFVMEHENFTYPEALRYIAQKYNIKIEETQRTDEEKQAQLESESLNIINQFARDFYQNRLFNDPIGKAVGLSYFKERGFREHTIKKFELGFAPNQKSELTDLAKQKGYEPKLLNELGLTTQYGGDFFKNRVMFTIHGLSGKPIAFAGRSLSTEDKRSPKYINSPETKVYVKSKILYGLFFARQAIRKKDNCYLVEGYTDVISMYQAGVENVVASSGTSLTKDQIKAVQRYTQNITVLYDGDPAGIKAALRGLDMILAEGMNVRLVLLPEGEDPDSFVQSQGLDNFEKFISEESKDFILFKTQLLEEETKNDPIKRSLMIKEIVRSVSMIPDSIKRSIYIQQLGDQLKMDEAVLVDHVNKFIREDLKKKSREADRAQLQATRQQQRQQIGPQNFPSKEPGNSQQGISKNGPNNKYDDGYFPTVENIGGSSSDQPPSADHPISLPTQTESNLSIYPDEHQEKDLMRVLVSFGHQQINKSPDEPYIAEFIFQNIQDIVDSFDNPLYQRILKLYVDTFAEGSILSNKDMIRLEDEEIRSFVIDSIASPYAYSKWDENEYPLQTQPLPDDNFMTDSIQAIMRLKLRKIHRQIKENQLEIQNCVTKENHQDELRTRLEMHGALKEQERIITSEFKNVLLG